jgi:hypothetical protein
MVASQSSVVQTSLKPHLHIAGQRCPFCEQEIPPDKLEEISGRIAAREQARLSEATGRLREQHAREKAHADAKAKAELEQARRDGAAEVHRLKAEAATREAAICEQATKVAEEAAGARLGAAERARKESEAVMMARITQAEMARQVAQQAQVRLSTQLQQVRSESVAAIQQAARDAAARETAIRAEATRAAAAAVQTRLAAAEEAKTTAEQAKAAAELQLRNQLSAANHQMQSLQEAHANEINHQREVLEKDKIASVNAERAKNLETKMKLEEQLQDMQRRLQKKTADEHGEGAELEMFDELRAAFPDDRIRRVQKGTPGADIIHEVVENGKVCGKIVYDSKNRGNWQSAYAVKLRDDQIAERADHAILSTNKFPEGEQQLCMREHVIVACPARVIALAALVRGYIVLVHELRVSNEAREQKAAELYAFITSERCRQLLDSVETLIKKIEEIEVAEQKAHNAVWRKRGELLKSVLKANGVFCFEIGRITGTAEAAE